MGNTLIFDKSIYFIFIILDYIEGDKMYIRKYKGTEASDITVSDLQSLLKNIYASKNLNFLLGSGCSAGAIPIMGDTFKKSKAKIQKKVNESEISEEYVEIFKEVENNIELYLNWLKKGMDYLRYDRDKKQKCEFVFDLVKTDLIGSIYIDYTKGEAKEVLNKYKKFYSQIFDYRKYKPNNPVNIFTTNYDLFNEIALEQSSINYVNGFVGNVIREFSPNVYNLRIVDEEDKYRDQWNPLRRFVRLYKLHGSIDWIYKEGKIIQKTYEYSSGQLLDKKNAIIYPTLEKHFETLISPYSELFREMNINLQKADTTLVVIGYGFADDHINNLIKQNLKDNTFTLIVFNDDTQDRKEFRFFEENRADNYIYISGELNEGEPIYYFDNILNILSVDREEDLCE